MAADIYHAATTQTLAVGIPTVVNHGIIVGGAATAPLAVIPTFEAADSIGGAPVVAISNKTATQYTATLQNVTGRFTVPVRLDAVYWHSPQGTA